MRQQELLYVLGLDLGIASVGWSVVEIDPESNPIRLIDCGVRLFERAEVPKTGDSLAAARRLARSQRRLIRRRAHRLLRLRRLFKTTQLLQPTDFDHQGFLKAAPMTWLRLDDKRILTEYPYVNQVNNSMPIGIWGWRVLALTQKLSPETWAHVLYHLVNHRGYLSQRKSERKKTSNSEKDLGKLLQGVQKNSEALKTGQYRSAADCAIHTFTLESRHLRNQRGDYAHTFDRKDLLAELKTLFDCQRRYGNIYAETKLEQAVTDLLMTQRPALSGEAILKMLGHCPFETNEYKAARATYSAERFIWLSKLNNLRILQDGVERALTAQEVRQLLNQPYQKSRLTYQQARSLLNIDDDCRFKGLRYGDSDASALKAENAVFMEMKAYHEIRKALENNGCKTEWASMANQPELLDKIGTAFAIYKTDEDITKYLVNELDSHVLNVLLENLNFDKFIQLSLKALHKLIPLMEQGKRYDEACADIYGSHTFFSNQQGKLYLPNIPADEVRNPVVMRSLCQARKVINAIIRQYGSPARVHIETARELGKSFNDRKKIETQQKENQADRQRAVARFHENFPQFIGEPRSQDILKFRLYEQQHCKCLYSGKSIDIKKLNDGSYVEIDHALPFSRTWDNSYNNKVLVLKSENQKKRNQTPYEYLDGQANSKQWQQFVAHVHNCLFPYVKKQRIMLPELDEEGFMARNLNDTRYIARFLCQFVESNLKLIGKGKKKVFASNGQITAYLRARWGLAKVREANDRHHALDAVVVACTTPAIQKRITDFMRQQEMHPFKGEMVNKETGETRDLHFPEPWRWAREEVRIRVFNDDPIAALREKLPDRPESVHEFVTPLFVSRAPNRKVTGQGHMETIKSAKYLEQGYSVSKIPLTQLKAQDIENIIGYEQNREPKLYEALRERLAEYDDDPQKAFIEPFYKPGKTESLQIMKSVRVKQQQKSGVLVRQGQGVADNATMVRIDIFNQNGKNYIVPIYTWQVEKGILPNKAVVAHATEDKWREMDADFQFRFSLYPNDLVEVQNNKEYIFGYYTGFDRSAGSIQIKVHDADIRKGKNGVYRGVGVKNVSQFNKYQVDVLGKSISIIKKEWRKDFQHKKQQ